MLERAALSAKRSSRRGILECRVRRSAVVEWAASSASRWAVAERTPARCFRHRIRIRSVKRLVWSCAAVTLISALTASASVASLTLRSATAAARTVPVVRCRTQTVGGSGSPVPSRIRVLGSPSTTAGLVAYTNSELFLVGPARMICSGVIAQDGGTQLLVWPRGRRQPRQHSDEDGLTLIYEPACVGCQAEDACPFFAAFARGLGFSCSTGVPAEEKVTRPGSHLALFEDPPGVAGDGWPSGGRDPANGAVGVQGSLNPGPHERSVYRSTCTLPARNHSICTVSLDDVIARYG